MVLQFTFFSTDEFGERLLLGARIERNISVAEAAEKVAHMMQQLTFTEGKADHCVIEDQDDETVQTLVYLKDRKRPGCREAPSLHPQRNFRSVESPPAMP
jgi:hypothetical protein